MTLRQYFLLMILGTIIAFSCFGLLIVNTSHEEAGLLALGGVYLALFFSSFGLTTVIGLGWRLLKKKPHHFAPAQVEASFRQGLFLAAILIGSLIMQSKGVMNWWNLTLMIGAVSALEIIVTGAQMRR